MNLLFHSECTNQPLSVEPATQEVFHVELKDRKDKPLKLNRNKKKQWITPQPPCLSKCFIPRLLERCFFQRKATPQGPASHPPVDWTSPQTAWDEDVLVDSQLPGPSNWRMKEIQWQKLQEITNLEQVHPGERLLGLMMFRGSFCLKFQVRSCLHRHPKKRWNFPVESFQAKACIQKKLSDTPQFKAFCLEHQSGLHLLVAFLTGLVVISSQPKHF